MLALHSGPNKTLPMKLVFIFGVFFILGFAQCPGKMFDNIDAAYPQIDTIQVRRLYLGSLEMDKPYADAGGLDSLFIPILKLPLKTLEASQAAEDVLHWSADTRKVVVGEISLGLIKLAPAGKDTVFENIRIHHSEVGKAVVQFQDKKGKVDKEYVFSRPDFVIRIDTIFVRKAILKDSKGLNEWQQYGKDDIARKYGVAMANYERAKKEVESRRRESPDHVALYMTPILDGIQFNLGLVDSFLKNINSSVTLPELKANALLLDDILASLQTIIDDPFRDQELTISCDVFFEPGEFLIYPGTDLGRLRKFAADIDEYLTRMLAQHPAPEVVLIVRAVGYADGLPLKPGTEKAVTAALGRKAPVGNEDYVRRELNKMLSELRVKSVWDAVESNMGRDPSGAGFKFQRHFDPKGEEIPPGVLNPKQDDGRRRKVVLSVGVFKGLREGG